MIPLLGARTVTLRRFPAPTLDAEGRRVPGAAVVSSIRATVQAASERAMQWLPDGARIEDTIEVVTYDEIRPAVEGATDADVLDVAGLGQFTVLRVARSSPFAGQPQHWRAWATRRQARRP